MQSKGAIKALAIVFGLIFLYQLSFTVAPIVMERQSEKKAQEYVDGLKANGTQLDSLELDSVYKNYYEHYLEDTSKYNLLVKKFTYREAKEREINLGLDLKGGMNVTMEVSVKDVVKALAEGNATNPVFMEAMEMATKNQEKTNGDFVTLFGEAFEEVSKGGQLAPIFHYSLNKRININSSNEEVLSVLKEECDAAIDRSYQILSTRIDRFGVAQPNIQRIPGTGQISIELPGVKDAERVRNLLEGTAQLEFWETYNFSEIYQGFDQIDTKLANQAKAATAKNDEEKPAVEEPTENGETEGEENLTNEGDADQNGLLEQINQDGNPEGTTDETTANITDTNHPLYSLLIPSYSENGQPYATACVGRARESDTATINRMLRENKELLKDRLVLAWSKKPTEMEDGTKFFELVALQKHSQTQTFVLGGEVVTEARQDYDPTGKVEVSLQMNREGANEWRRITHDNIDKQIAIVLDNYVYSYPVVRNEIPNGSSSISGGSMTIEEAQDLANILKAGKLPAPARIIQEEVVGPSLGKESVQKGMWSMIVAFILILIYMIFFYKKAGLVADIALIVNVFFLFGVLACLGSVLTLPGIAGIVLTLGMAVDSNVIIFERIKEELRGGKQLRAAIDAGYKNAYSAIIDGNVTTLITGIVLIVLGTGPVHSFAVTLCIGILTSLFTSIFISRLIFTGMLDNNKDIAFTTNFTENFLKDTHFDFINFRKTAYIIAIVMVVISAGTLFIRPLNKGIDFTGGRNYIVRFDQDVKVDEVRDALSKVEVEGWETPEVKTYGPNGQVKITTKYKINDNGSNQEIDNEIQTILYQGLKGLFEKKDINFEEFSFASGIDKGNDSIGVMQTQKVGESIANEVIKKSIWAIAISLLLMFIYIAIRFRKWQYGLSALIALTHDTIIMIGIYTLLYNLLPFTMEVDQAFIAAVLTIIGYSINATVVIFDRVRENTTNHPKATWKENINNAVNSTLTRSFNTSGSTFVVLLAIFIFGGDSIRGFIFALLVGILAGTFSSVFLSSPIAYNLLKGHTKDKAIEEDNQNKKK